MQNIQINFSGFYNSRHSEKIDFAVDFEIDYFTSAKTNKNVDLIFNDLGLKFLDDK